MPNTVFVLGEILINETEKQYIHSLFETGNYIELYKAEAATIKKMLLITDQQDFEDYMKQDEFLIESSFWLYYSVVYGERLLIGAYDEDVTKKVTAFLKEKLPEAVFFKIKECLKDIYVDIDKKNNLTQKIGLCNQCLEDTGYAIQIECDDTYCVWDYFLLVTS